MEYIVTQKFLQYIIVEFILSVILPFFLVSIFEIGSHKLFAWVGPKLRFSWCLLLK
jgi:hypothetical protein